MAKFCLTLQMLKASLVAPSVILGVSNMTTLYSLASRWSELSCFFCCKLTLWSAAWPNCTFDPADGRGSDGFATNHLCVLKPDLLYSLTLQMFGALLVAHLCDLQPDLIVPFNLADVRGSAGVAASHLCDLQPDLRELWRVPGQPAQLLPQPSHSLHCSFL